MTSNSGQTLPGMPVPTQKGMLAGNPRDSAIQSTNNTNQKQANLSNAVGGSKKFKKMGGANNVPQFQMQYTSTNGPGQDPNSQIKQNSQTSTSAAANSVYDQQAMVKGGSKRRKLKKGGNSNWNWGCYSGGLKRKSSKSMKSSKSSKSRK